MSPGRLHVKDWLPLEERNMKKNSLPGREAPYPWLRGLLWLIQAFQVPSFITCLFTCYQQQPLRHWISKEEDSSGKAIAWKKYHLVKWEKVCRSKKKRGLGIKNTRNHGAALPHQCWSRPVFNMLIIKNYSISIKEKLVIYRHNSIFFKICRIIVEVAWKCIEE